MAININIENGVTETSQTSSQASTCSCDDESSCMKAATILGKSKFSSTIPMYTTPTPG